MITSYISEYIHEKRLRVSTGSKGQRVHDCPTSQNTSMRSAFEFQQVAKVKEYMTGM
jgi:hypothetical protein